ncbi:MAG TPA: hypothetical protein VKA46_33480 [Gemmataceae bacterium]|nr:hypothetical protein [Gemmataceae bacterium]
MIQMPRRSVTRFFIPLIDVLTLLFCIFLLMPLVKAPAEADENHSGSPDGDSERTGQDSAKERPDTPEKLRAELEQLRKAKMQVLQERLAVRVLEIDAKTGKLYYNDPERAEVSNEAEALALVQRDRRSISEGQRELYYEILYPRDPASPFPLLKQRETYDKWFKDVAHGWDIPGASLKGGKP